MNMSKKGLSIVVSYVLFVGIAVGLSIIVYSWLKSYVPKESLECPDGVSIAISQITYESATKRLNLTLRNNGRFSIDGFYIRASNKSSELKDISELNIAPDMIILNPLEKSTVYGNQIRFLNTEFNSLAPGEFVFRAFNLSKYGQVKKIEIIPIRYEKISGKMKLLQCSNAKIQEILTYNA
jgi:hypothetical protein